MGTKTKRLAKARKMRVRMGNQLKELSDGRKSIEDILRMPTVPLARCRIYDVLRRTPGLGTAGAKKILQTNNIWPEDRLGQLSIEERQAIIESLPQRVTGSGD